MEVTVSQPMGVRSLWFGWMVELRVYMVWGLWVGRRSIGRAIEGCGGGELCDLAGDFCEGDGFFIVGKNDQVDVFVFGDGACGECDK